MIRRLASPAWAMLEYGWFPLLAFVTTPYFWHALGEQRFAYWILLTATVGFGGILNAGTGTATIKLVSAARGTDDAKAAELTIRTALAIAIAIGGALALVIFAIFWFGGTTLFNEMGDADLVHLTGAVAAVLIWIEQLENVFASALKGAEYFGPAARVEILSKTAQIVVALLVFALTGSFGGLYLSLIVVGVLRLALKASVARRLLGLTSLRPRFGELGKVLGYAKWGWVQGLAGMLFGIVDRLLIGALLGSAALAHYSVVTQLTQQIHAVPAAATSVLFPKVSRRLEAEGSFSLSRLTKWTMLASGLASSAMAGILLLFGTDILRLWLGPAEAAAGSELLYPLTLAYWLLAQLVVPYFLLLGIGRIRFVGLASLAAAVSAIICLYLATDAWGVAGAPWGRVVYAIGTFSLLVPLTRHLRARGSSRLPPMSLT